MKSISLIFVSVLILGPVSGGYAPTIPIKLPDCGCGLTEPVEIDINPKSDDTKYKFDFEVQQPEAAESNVETKSYGYKIQRPVEEKSAPDTKYQFDYIVQEPEIKSDEKSERTYSGRVDRVTDQKRGSCSCKYNPCDCYNDRSASRYILPMRYRGDDAFGRLRRSIGRTKRIYRQAPTTLEDHWDNIKSFAAKAGEAIANPSDALKDGVSKLEKHAQNIKEHFEKITSPSETDAAKEHFDKIVAAMHPDKIKEHFQKITNVDSGELRDKISRTFDPSKIKDSIAKIADPIIGHASNIMQNPDEFFKGFKENFAVPVSRSKRNADKQSTDGDYDDADESDETNEQNDDQRYPVLKVNERPMPCKTIQNLKELSRTRVELQSPEYVQYVPELAMTDNVEQMPQYVEYVDGQAVSYKLRKADENPERTSDMSQKLGGSRVVFDRYGHRYFENNGNLRLAVPQYQEAMVGDQPNFAGLADILNQNQEVIHELNPLSDPTRLVPMPTEIAADGIDLIRDIARRSADYQMNVRDSKKELKKKKKYYNDKTDQQSQVTMEEDNSKLELNETPKSIYQMLPMNIDDHEGKLLVRVYSNKDVTKQSENDTDRAVKKPQPQPRPRPRPFVQKMSRGDEDFEVITFDESSPATSDEEIQEIYQLYYGDLEK